MGRPPCCDKSNVKRGLWTAEEDAKILAYVANHGIGNWTLVPQKAGLNRCGKSCRLRWTNYLRPDLKHDTFTPEEEQLIIDYHKAIGSRWSLIAKQLPGRTDNDVKNYWNTKLKKKLSKMGIDPVTHKPISQILSDYGKISGLPNTGKRIDLLNNSMKNMSIMELASTSMINKPLPNQQFQDQSFIRNIVNHETLQPHFFTEISSPTSSSSSSSSSSSHSVTQLSSSQPPFSCLPSQVSVTPSSDPSVWNTEFLLGDPILFANMEQKQDCPTTLQNNVIRQERACEAVYNGGQTKHSSEASNSSCANSFVESILDRDSEMQLEFPEFLNEYFNY